MWQPWGFVAIVAWLDFAVDAGVDGGGCVGGGCGCPVGDGGNVVVVAFIVLALSMLVQHNENDIACLGRSVAHRLPYLLHSLRAVIAQLCVFCARTGRCFPILRPSRALFTS